MLTLNSITPAMSTIDDVLKLLMLLGDKEATATLLQDLKVYIGQKADIDEARRQSDLAIQHVSEVRQALDAKQAHILAEQESLSKRWTEFSVAQSGLNRRERDVNQREESLAAERVTFEAELVAARHGLEEQKKECVALSQQAKEVKEKYEAKLAALKTLTA
jgi:chromosome segregation ATPase